MSKIRLQNLLKTHTRRSQVFMHISRYLTDYFAAFRWKPYEKILIEFHVICRSYWYLEIWFYYCVKFNLHRYTIKLSKKYFWSCATRIGCVLPIKKVSYPLLQTIWRNIVYYVLRGFIVINCLIVAAHKKEVFFGSIKPTFFISLENQISKYIRYFISWGAILYFSIHTKFIKSNLIFMIIPSMNINTIPIW